MYQHIWYSLGVFVKVDIKRLCLEVAGAVEYLSVMRVLPGYVFQAYVVILDTNFAQLLLL